MARQSFAPGDYFKVFNLSQDPFQINYIRELFFTSPETQHRLDLIKHLLEVSQQVLLIKGVEKVGKSLFVRHLLATAGHEWAACQIDATHEIDPDILIRTMTSKQQGDAEEASKTITVINKYLAHCNLIGKIPVLFVDNANKLNEKTLRFIFQLMSFREQETFIRIVLIGQDSLLQRLNEIAEESSSTGLVHTINIPAFDLKETTGYLRYLLTVCGGREDMFSEKEISRIHKVSGGLVGNISYLARQGLSDPAELDQKMSSSKVDDKTNTGVQKKALLVIACLLITFFVIYVWSNLQKDESLDMEQISLKLPEEQTSISRKNSDKLNRKESIPVAQSDMGAVILEDKRSPLNSEAVDLTVDIPEELKISSINNIEVSTQGETVSKLGQPDSQITLNRTEIVSSEIRGNEWLRQQSGDRYVLQLIGAVEMATIKRFLKGAQVDHKQLSLYQTIQADKPWHVLVYGLYSDREEAKIAISTLSKDVQQGKPWPKSISSIHKAIKSPK